MGHKPEDKSLFAVFEQANARARATGQQAEARAFEEGVKSTAQLLHAMSRMLVAHFEDEAVSTNTRLDFARSWRALREAAGTLMGAAGVQAASKIVDDVFGGVKRYVETAEERERISANAGEASEIQPNVDTEQNEADAPGDHVAY